MMPPAAPPVEPSMGMDPNAPPPNPMVTIPMTDEEQTRWKGDIERADRRRKVYEPSWETNLSNYAPDPTNAKWGDDINPGVHFFTVEQKKALLFFDTPHVILTPQSGANPQAVQAQQDRLNDKLGRDGIKGKALVDLVLLDTLCPAGMGCVSVGYTNISKPTQVPVPQQWTPLGTPPAEPQFQTANVPVFEEVFCEHFSVKKLLIPANAHINQADKWPWVGQKFTLPLKVAKRQFSLPDDFNAKSKGEDQVFRLPGSNPSDEGDEEQVTGTALFYKASLYDEQELHPQKIRELVFIDGSDEPVVHRDSRYQDFDQAGKLSETSLIGFPIKVCYIRDLSDSPYVPSDCTIIRPLVNEISRFRTQLVEHRDASTSVRLADETVISNEVMAKIIRSPYGAILPIANYNSANPPIMEIGKPAMSRENFQSQEIIGADLAKVTAISANQSGTQQDNIHSATEIATVQRNADVRMQAERNRVVEWFLDVVRAVDTLLRRYPPMGQPPQPALGRYSYSIKPDSGMHVDAAADRKFGMDAYNFLAKDPNINRMELLKEILPLMRLDPTKLITQPPPQEPPKPKTSVIARGEDLSPLAPQYANMVEILNQGGFKLTPTQITPALMDNAATVAASHLPVPHPGTANKADLVDKHTADESGQMQNMGGMARP